MYLVGLKNNSWKIITNGIDVFSAETDLRHHSELPHSSTARSGVNRISKLQLSPEDLICFCKSEGIDLRGLKTKSEMLKKASGPAAIAGGVGAIIGGPVGAALGAGFFGWLNHNSDGFEDENLARVFQEAKKKSQAWREFDLKKEEYITNEKIEYEKKARENWERYFRLRNMDYVDELEGVEFERLVHDIYEKNGYKVKLTSATSDYGVDIIAELNGRKLAIQVKRYASNVGIKAIQEVASGSYYYKADKAVVVTNSSFTSNARELAKSLGVQLVDRSKLFELWIDAFPESSVPEFSMEMYEQQKQVIKSVLRSFRSVGPLKSSAEKDLHNRLFISEY